MREIDAAELSIDLAALAPFVAAIGPLAVVDFETTGLPEEGDTFTSMTDQSSHEVCSVGIVGGTIVSVVIF